MTARAPQVSYTIQLEVELGEEGHLDWSRSRNLRVKSALAKHARTTQGNFLMMDESEKSRMSSLYLTEFTGSSIDTSLAPSVHDTGSQMEIRQITQLDWNVPCPACIEIDNIYVNSNPYSTRIFLTLKNGKLFFLFSPLRI